MPNKVTMINTDSTRPALDLMIPRVPNFILLAKGPDEKEQQKVSISKIGDAGLQEIGKFWAQNLLARAQEIRESEET